MSCRIPFLCKKNLFSSFDYFTLLLSLQFNPLCVVLFFIVKQSFYSFLDSGPLYVFTSLLQPSNILYLHSYKKGYAKRKSFFLLTHPPWFCLYSLIQVGQTCFHVLCISSLFLKTLAFICKNSGALKHRC